MCEDLMGTNGDKILTSRYINDVYYQKLVNNFSNWQRIDLEIRDLIFRDSCRRFLAREARFLDLVQLEEWLKLYASECVYWVPGSAGGGDPRKEVAISFDDRRRLEDRIFRLATGAAWSQWPASRTVRVISNVEVYATDEVQVFMVRSNFQTTEFQAERVNPLRQSHRGLVAHAASRSRLVSDMDDSTKKCTGGQNDGSGNKSRVISQDNAFDALIVHDEVCDLARDDRQIRRRFHLAQHGIAIKLTIGLGAGPLHSRPRHMVQGAHSDHEGQHAPTHPHTYIQ